MVRFAAILLLLILATPAYSGDTVYPVARKEFKQRTDYPYIFEPVCYLENRGPMALHFGAASNSNLRFDPPPLKLAKKENSADSAKYKAAVAALAAAEAARKAALAQSGTAGITTDNTPDLADLPTAPSYPPPENTSSVTRPESLDMNRYPSEVIEIFKNPYNVPKVNRHFFEPVFEPAQRYDALPSKATYRQE